MKNLYLAILLLAFAANLSAFDKVWELQFSSTPHHVHYTEGHKELIVGEGNTFKKYNAETGALIDSVVYNLDVLKDYTVGEYHVTDDLKSLYVSGINKDSSFIASLVKLNIKNNNFEIVFNQYSSYLKNDYFYSYTFPGSLYQLSSEEYVYSFYANTQANLPLFNGHSGAINIIKKDTNIFINNALTNIFTNIYSKSALLLMDYYSSYKSGMGRYTDYYEEKTIFYNGIIDTSIIIPEIYKLSEKGLCISKSNKYIYAKSNDYTYQYDFNKFNSQIINTENKYYNYYNKIMFAFNSNEEEIITYYNRTLYQYNFRTNRILDSISIKDSVSKYISNMEYGYITTIDTNNRIISYKSSFPANKVISCLKDTIITKSVVDTITLNAISNLNPIKEEWDLGDGRTMNGDTIQFTYPKKGEYLVKYTGTYKDSVVNLTCKVKVLDTLALSFTHKVEMKQGYTELTITSEFRGDFDKVIYNPNPSKGKTDLAYVLTDSSLNKVTYRIFTSDIYNFTVSIANSIKTISKSIELIIPVNSIKNTDYNLIGLNRIINILPLKDDIFFQDYSYSYTTIYPENQNGPGGYKISVNCLLNTVNKTFQRETKISSNWTASIGTYQAGIESIAIYKSKNKLYLKNNMLLICDDLSGKFNIIQDKIETFTNTTIDMSSITYLDIQNYKDSYLLYTYYPNNNPVSIGVVNSLYNVSKNDLIGKKYNGKNHDIFCYGTLCVIDTNIYMQVHNTNYKAYVYKLNSDFDILDTITIYPYLSSYSRAINGKYTYSLIDSAKNSKSKQLVTIDIANKKTSAKNLVSTINYHQVFQLKKDVSCLVGTKNDELIIQAFKDGETAFTDFVIPINIPFNIVGMTKDNELHLNHTASGTISSYIRTKGFAEIFKSLASSSPDDSTSNPIDTTKNKGIIQSAENQFGTVIQDQDFKAAKIYFKDSLDLSNSFVNIYTEAGTEILTYSLNKDQKELPIQTDKLYHGIYYVRLLNKSEEHNIGKFIIIR